MRLICVLGTHRTDNRFYARRYCANRLRHFYQGARSVVGPIACGQRSRSSHGVGRDVLALTFFRELHTLDERSAIFRRACDTASLRRLADFTRSAWSDYHPREGQEREPPENCLTTEGDAEQLRVLLRSRIKAVAAVGTLLAHRDLPYLLHWWVDLTVDDGTVVRAWTSGAFASDDDVRQLAKAFTSYGWTQAIGFGGMDDVVAQRVTRVNLKGMARLLNLEEFRLRVEAVAIAGAHPEAWKFLEAWQRADQGRDD
jgi:hypothetical protein